MQKVGVAKLGPSTQSDLSDLKDLIAQAEKEMLALWSYFKCMVNMTRRFNKCMSI